MIDRHRGLLARAMGWSVLSQYGSELIGFASVLILARLLTPAEIGVFSVALAIVNISHELREFGTPQYVIQERELSLEKLRAATGMTFLMAWIVGALVLAVSPFASAFFSEPGLETVLLVMACNFFIIPLNGLTEACLQREMEFGSLLKVNLVTNAVYGVMVVALAFIGFGFLSMAWATLVSTIVSVGMLNLFRPDWCPLLPSLRGLAGIWSFGSFTSIGAIARKLSEAVPELVVARGLGMEAVGYYSRGFGLVSLFNRGVTLAIRPVILPHLSAEERSSGGGRVAYLEMMRYMTALSWPFFACLALLAFPVMRLLYGEQWDAAVPAARVLCLWAAVESLFAFAGEALLATGGARQVFAREAAAGAIRLCAVLLAVGGGLVAVSAALCAAAVFEQIVTGWFLNRRLEVTAGDAWGAVRANLLVTAASVLGPVAVVLWFGAQPASALPAVALGGAGAVAGWLLGLVLTRHPLWSLIRDVGAYRGPRR